MYIVNVIFCEMQRAILLYKLYNKLQAYANVHIKLIIKTLQKKEFHGSPFKSYYFSDSIRHKS